MRKLVAGLFISLDGVTEAPNEWQFDNFDEGMIAALQAHIDGEGTVFLGRRTYEEWCNYWPTSNDEPYASHINNVPKYVVSTTLKDVSWGKWKNIKLINGNPAKTITELKRQPGKNIGIAGSPTLVRTLLQDDLIDEFILMFHPVIVGKGKRLFGDGGQLKRLKLIESTTTPTGVSILRYQPVKG